jgi:hypothetical protein
MNYKTIIVELPTISDEAAASLKKFIEALNYAVDEHYYKQIHRHYLNQLNNLIVDDQSNEEELDNPPF